MAAAEHLIDAVASGDRRRALEALRDRLAATIDEAEPREVAALARQLTIVLEQLSSLPAQQRGTPLDEVHARRAARRSAGAAPS